MHINLKYTVIWKIRVFNPYPVNVEYRVSS